ncbi:MAG: glycosyltransferase family 4 protein [Promethearchaeota archaeon]
MKIGMVSHSFLPQIGGKELYIYHLAKELARLGHEPHVVTSNARARYEVVTLRGIAIHLLPSIALKIPRTSASYYRFMPTLFRFLDRMRFDLLNLQEYSTSATDLSTLFGYLRNVPTVLTVHNPWFLSNALYNVALKVHQSTLGRLEAKVFDRVIVVSRVMRAKFVNAFPELANRIVLVNNGVSLDYYHPTAASSSPGGAKKILFLSRISKEKGVKELVEAFARLCKKHDDLRLLIVGPRTEFVPQVNRQVQRLGLSDRVEIRPPVLGRNKVAVIDESDCMCLPSFIESCPSTILEAMAMNKPIVATRIPGILELLPSDDYGWLVEPGDVEDLASGLEGALFNDKASEGKTQKARLHVENYDWSRVGKRVLEVFNEAIADHSTN